MRLASARAAVAFTLALAALASAPAPADDDPYTRARALYKDGKQDEAIASLRQQLAVHPGDDDARVVLGGMLSWRDRYDEARAVLDEALAHGPRGDVLRALINVELWSGHPERAEKLAALALEKEPNAADLRVARARALRDSKRLEEARLEVEKALSLAPGNEAALGLHQSLLGDLRTWQVDLAGSTDFFNDHRPVWWDASTSLSRHFGFGSVIFRASHAHRFGEDDNLFELESYPAIREGTYAFLSVGFSPQAILYPHARVAADLYQNLGAGFEASLGYRGLFFDSPVHILTGSFGKYFGNWFAFARAYYVLPASSGSLHLNLRRYLPDGQSYFGIRYAHGLSKEELLSSNDIALDSSDTLALEASLWITGAWTASARASAARQARAGTSDLWDYSLAAGVGYRF